ncbi:hypothetical protein [Flavobacterium humidisoli]|nr:hypothetical protein [Flavobacterium humidisoli]
MTERTLQRIATETLEESKRQTLHDLLDNDIHDFKTKKASSNAI